MKKKSLFLLFFFVFFSLFAAEINWRKAEDVQTGVKLLKFSEEKPRLMKINLMRIDLDTPGLYFTATGRDADWGKPMPDQKNFTIRTKRIRTRDFMKNARKDHHNMIVAVNAAPWVPWEVPFTHKYADPLGVNIFNGEIISNNAQTVAFVVYKNGKREFTTKLPESKYNDVLVAVSGFFPILKKGKILPHQDNLAPRVAFGLSRNRRYLYILTVDGRQKNWSMGATMKELAQYLLDAGAYDGINMDGGGSSTLIY